MDNYPSENTIRILITTDNHVGYNENDPMMSDDSWKSFHEIMMIAKQSNVDLILQSGDLFHVNKPSKKSMYQVMKSMRLALMGDKPCELELLNDPSIIFQHNDFSNINYEDPNFNISIPMFCISGNHDDACGDGLLCPMDILQVSGLINLFGKVLESDNIEVTPLLFQKGNTKLGLYGLASVRDERLFRTFKEGNIKFNVPNVNQDEWFNIMCVHQNHTGHTNTAFLPESFLPDFLDLVIWGHEHECIPHLIHNPSKNFDVLQPGSSIATSLCEAESRLKQIFILEITHNEPLKLVPIPLKTVRPFKIKDIILQDIPNLQPHNKEAINDYLYNQIDLMIEEANNESKERLGTNDNIDIPLPLIRLRVNYSSSTTSNIDFQVENPRRFSNRFVGRVANANNVVQFYKKKKSYSNSKKPSDMSISIEKLTETVDDELQIHNLVTNLLKEMELSLLPETGLNEAIRKFVDKDEKNALKQFIDQEINHEVDILSKNKDITIPNDTEDLKGLLKHIKSMPISSKSNEKILPTGQIEVAAQYLKSNLQDNSMFEPKGIKKLRRNRSSKSTSKPLENIQITISDEDNLDMTHQCIEFNNDIIQSNNTEPEVAHQAMSRGTRQSAHKNTSSQRTPKTDVLSSLLARKRR